MSKLLNELLIFIFSLVEASLVLRFVLKLLGANPAASFVAFIYQNTEPLLAPFLFAFPTPSVNGRFVVEFTTLFAIFVYAFISYILQEVLAIMQKK